MTGRRKSLGEAGVSGVGDQKHSKLNKENGKPRACVYCEGTGHKPCDCNKVVSVDERKKILSKNSSALIALVLNIGLQSVVVGQDPCTEEDITHRFATEEQPIRC